MKKRTLTVLFILSLLVLVMLVDSKVPEDIDIDKDGFDSILFNGSDCDDNDSMVYPGADEYCNTIDDNCNGIIDEVNMDCMDEEICKNGSCVLRCKDEDEDGYYATDDECSEGNDCNDNNHNIHPFATEICNGVDDDCNLLIDELILPVINGTNAGECEIEVIECRNGTMNITIPGVYPSEDVCDGKDNDCDGESDEDDVCIDFIFNVISPVNKVYNRKSIAINLTSDILLDRIYFSDNFEREKTVCRNCKDFGYSRKKFIRLNDGMHRIYFRAVDGNLSVIRKLDVFIDSKKPKLVLPSLRTVGFTNGTFYVMYNELNLANLTLNFDGHETVKTDCPSGDKQTCVFFVNVSQDNGKSYYYSIRAVDAANNHAESQNISIIVDNMPPVIENNDSFYKSQNDSILFSIKINESNLESVKYIDYDSLVPRWKILCSKLDENSMCIKEIRFSPGTHNIKIKIIDKALNILEVSI